MGVHSWVGAAAHTSAPIPGGSCRSRSCLTSSPLSFPKSGVTVQKFRYSTVSTLAGSNAYQKERTLLGNHCRRRQSHRPPLPTGHSSSAHKVSLFAGAARWNQVILTPIAIHVAPLISFNAAWERPKTEKVVMFFWTLASC